MINPEKLLKLSTDLICTIDAQGYFIDVSAASWPVLGYRQDELCGKSYRDFIFPADLESADKAVQEIITGRPQVQLQNRYRHKDGRIVPLLWSAQWDEPDQLLYCIARDGHATEQGEAMRLSLEESNLRYRYVTKATSDAIWDWDLISGTLYWGEGFETIFGYDPEMVPPGIDSWTAHIHPEDSKSVLQSIYKVIKGQETNWKKEYRYQKADGTFADVVDRGFVIRNETGIAVRMVGAMHDISERKKALTEMKRVTDDLYKHNRELHEFGYIVSHNLRSPVANIMGIADLLELEEHDPETVSHCIKSLKNSVSHLDEVIRDLSKILSATDHSAALKKERVDLSEKIRNIQIALADQIGVNQARINMTQGKFVLFTHKAYIYSIFLNLISNAIKYRSDAAPVIDITVSVKRSELLIRLSDNGSGIDLKRYGEDLFKPYKRFHTHTEGKGLGLFLVKSHVETLGGQIDVDSTAGKGTTFTIRLPKDTLKRQAAGKKRTNN